MIAYQKFILSILFSSVVISTHTMEQPRQMVPSPSALDCRIHNKAQTLLKRYSYAIRRGEEAVALWGDNDKTAHDFLNEQQLKYTWLYKAYNIFQEQKQNRATTKAALIAVDNFIGTLYAPRSFLEEMSSVFVTDTDFLIKHSSATK